MGQLQQQPAVLQSKKNLTAENQSQKQEEATDQRLVSYPDSLVPQLPTRVSIWFMRCMTVILS